MLIASGKWCGSTRSCATPRPHSRPLTNDLRIPISPGARRHLSSSRHSGARPSYANRLPPFARERRATETEPDIEGDKNCAAAIHGLAQQEEIRSAAAAGDAAA